MEEKEQKEKELEAQKNAPPEPPIIKPNSIKPSEMLPSIIKRKETPVQTIDVKQERAPEAEPQAEQLAPVPVTAAPVGQ